MHTLREERRSSEFRIKLQFALHRKHRPTCQWFSGK